MSDTLLDMVGREIGRFLVPIDSVVDDPTLLDQLMASVGISTPDAERDALLTALTAIATLKTQIDALLAQPSRSISDIAAVLEISRQAFAALRALDGVVGSSAEFAGFGQELAGRLITNYLFYWHPLLRSVTALMAIQELAEDIEPTAPIVRDGELVRGSFSVDRFHFDRLVSLLRDPAAALRGEYGNALATSDDAGAMADKLFPRLHRVLRELGVSCRYGFDPDDTPLLGDAAPFLDHALIVYADDKLAGAPAEAGIALTISAADRGDLGLVISPFGTLASTRQAGSWRIELKLTAGVDVVAYGRHGLTLLASAETTEVAGSLSATLMQVNDEPGFIFGAPDGTRIEVGGARLAIDTSLSEARQSLALSADVSSAAIVIAPGDADSFLSSVLPADGLRAKFGLGVTWSNEHGLTFRGAAGLDATLPVDISMGGASVPTVHLGLDASDAGLLAEVSASVGVSIGPVDALVDRVGINTAVTFPEAGGNLGVADLHFGFKPPSGVGLAIDATCVSGGGHLLFDPEKGQYAGDIQLNLDGGITVTAIGLIATHLPNGAKGFSFVVLITAQGFKPIPLGLGFTLTGIGGLLAINRTCNQEFLREGIKSKTLDSLLFPDDPIRNAVQILGTLNNAFPPRDGSYLFGPVVQICWGTPPVLTMDLGLILELGNRTRLIILGRVSAIMPSEKHDLLRLQMNVLGILDFDQHSIALDAILYDSRLVGKFPVTGSMAMRLKWGSAPAFALSIGGFHPAFKPPANFPTLERLAISLSNTDDFRLRAESYIALTANTLQFGAKVELFAKAGGFSIEGLLGYDVLIQFDPFFFLADFYASVQLKYGSDNLFKVKVEGELAGPKPLHIKGKATFEIFWCDFSVHFDKTLVAGDPPPQLAPVIVMDQLKVALNEPRNWSGQLAEGDRRLVTLHERQAPDQIALHPLGTLSVKQTVVPLELQISRFGNTTPAGARLFRINSLSVNGKNTEFSPVKDFFAPSQFLDLSDDERLAAPSFEAMTAGIRVGTESFVFTTNDLDIVSDDTIKYETIILDEEENQARPAPTVAITAEFLNRHLSLGAAARSEVRRTGTARYRSASSKNSLVKKGWTIASTEDASAQAAPGLDAGKVVSYAESFQALQQLKQVNPVKAKTLMLMRVGVGEIEKKVK